MTGQTVQSLLRYTIESAPAESGGRRPAPAGAARPAREDGEEARFEEAAHEFESLFVAYLFKVMRATIEESGLFEENAGRDLYTDLFDREVARVIARRGALGISDLLLRQYETRAQEGSGAVSSGAQPDSVQESGIRAEPGAAAGIPDFRLPVRAPVSSAYGLRRDPLCAKERFHRGVDLAAPAGTGVVAASGGRVVFAGYQMGYGNTVVVEHERGYRTRYAHLGSLAVSAGDAVQARQSLGTVGSSGRSTGPHLHFEISEYGESIDPRVALAH